MRGQAPAVRSAALSAGSRAGPELVPFLVGDPFNDGGSWRLLFVSLDRARPRRGAG
jgi:hypothetical protein